MICHFHRERLADLKRLEEATGKKLGTTNAASADAWAVTRVEFAQLDQTVISNPPPNPSL
jgi:hypothetical protein